MLPVWVSKLTKMFDNAIFVGCEIWYEFMLLVGPSGVAGMLSTWGTYWDLLQKHMVVDTRT